MRGESHKPSLSAALEGALWPPRQAVSTTRCGLPQPLSRTALHTWTAWSVLCLPLPHLVFTRHFSLINPLLTLNYICIKRKFDITRVTDLLVTEEVEINTWLLKLINNCVYTAADSIMDLTSGRHTVLGCTVLTESTEDSAPSGPRCLTFLCLCFLSLKMFIKIATMIEKWPNWAV